MRRLAGVVVVAVLAGCGLLTNLDGLRGTDAAAIDAPAETTVEAASPTSDQPPPRPDGGVPSSQTTVFAISHIYLGDTDRSGTASKQAWAQFGYDIDDKITTASSTDVCQLVDNAATSTQVDGLLGIDNSFGENLMPTFQGLSSAGITSTAVSQRIANGQWTLLIEIDGLGNDPSQTSIGLTAGMMEGAPLGSPPAFDSTTNWPVLSTSLVDGATLGSGPKLKFDAAYVNGGTFVSGASQMPVPIQVLAQGAELTLLVHHAVVTFDHLSPDVAANGVIAGILDTQELEASLKTAAGRLDKSLCSGAVIDSILEEIAQASDIFVDGTNSANGTCTGISIGLGFDARAVALPTTVTSAGLPPPDPCAD